jgi:hypothetical protein
MLGDHEGDNAVKKNSSSNDALWHEFILVAFGAGLVYGVQYLASFFSKREWHLRHYLGLIALALVVTAAIAIYRRSRQILP